MIQPGTVINGRFRVLRQMGSGGYGQIIAAHDSVEARPVALKFQFPRTFESTTRYAREGEEVKREFRLGKSLSGLRGIPKFYTEDEYLGRRFVAMDLVAGVTLVEVLEQRRPANSATVAAVIGQLCEILEPIHARGIVHRDIKLDNIMVADDGEVWLLDLGISVRVGEEIDFVCGTAGYAPPEQYTEQSLTVQADIYALGAVLFEMSAMYLPYADLAGRPDRHADPFPGGRLDTMDAGLRSLGLAMIAWNPEARPANVSEILTQIQSMFPALGSSRHPKAPHPDPTAWYRDRRPAR